MSNQAVPLRASRIRRPKTPMTDTQTYQDQDEDEELPGMPTITRRYQTPPISARQTTGSLPVPTWDWQKIKSMNKEEMSRQAHKTALLLVSNKEQGMNKSALQARFKPWAEEDRRACEARLLQAGISPTEGQMADMMNVCFDNRLAILFNQWAKDDAQAFLTHSRQEGRTPTDEEITEVAHACFNRRYALLMSCFETTDTEKEQWPLLFLERDHTNGTTTQE